MAKQLGIIQFAGKLGNLVGMTNGFESSKTPASVNFVREKVANIKNPQSISQMDQRAKMLPAVLFRRQIQEVIARAWEGKKFGGPSIREFMKYALKEPWANVPQLPKDSVLAIPGRYLISRGSLPSIGYGFQADFLTTTLDYRVNTTAATTIGNISTALLTNNSFLREGDQLTFIIAKAPANIPYVVYTIDSFYLNSGSAEVYTDVLRNINFQINADDGTLRVFANDEEQTLLGGAVVLSREGTSSAQRSTQRFALNDSALTAYFANSLKESIAATYRTTQNAAIIDWPYDEAQEDTSLRLVDGTYTIQGLTGNLATLNGSLAKVRVAEDAPGVPVQVYGLSGDYALGGTQPFAVNANNNQPLQYTQGENVMGLSITQVPGLASLPVIAL